MKSYFKTLMGASLVLALSLSACSKEEEQDTPPPSQNNEKGSMVIKLEHGWGPLYSPFALGQKMTHPLTSEDIEFSTLRYYFSNIVLGKADGSEWQELESYRIVDLQNGSEVELRIDSIPVGRYEQIRFTIGVDSLRNVSGAQTGALDPAENMFWSWNSGYIFIKAEGNSSASPSGDFVYHIGGFSGPNNAIRSPQLSFDGAALDIARDSSPAVHLKVNTARFWHGGISLGDLSNVHMPGPDAKTLADNFGGAFKFDHIHR